MLEVDRRGVEGKGEERGDWGGRGTVHVNAEFVFPDGVLLDVFREAGHQVLAVLVEGDCFVGVFGGFVHDWGLERAGS
jgi:hypothetical protein